MVTEVVNFTVTLQLNVVLVSCQLLCILVTTNQSVGSQWLCAMQKVINFHGPRNLFSFGNSFDVAVKCLLTMV